MSEEFSGERDSLSYKQLLEQLKVRLDYVWLSAHSPAVSRQELLFSIENMNNKIFSGQVTYLENWRSSIFCTISCQQVSTFRFEQSFWLSEQFRAVFSFVLGTNEDGFEAPEGLHYRHIRQIYPNQRSVHNYVAIITEPFSSSSPFRAARQAGYCAGCVRAGHRLALLS